MPGILKIGATDRLPFERLRESNVADIPTPFRFEFAKRVLDTDATKRALHLLLSRYTPLASEIIASSFARLRETCESSST